MMRAMIRHFRVKVRLDARAGWLAVSPYNLISACLSVGVAAVVLWWILSWGVW